MRKNNKIKESYASRAFDVFNVCFMLLLSAIMLYPYLNQLAVSLNEGQDTMRGGITIFPRVFTLKNYAVVFNNSEMKNAAVISVARTLIGTLYSLTVTTAAAYALSRKNMPYRKQILWFLIFPTFISAGLIPAFINYRRLHLLNSFWIYILPGAFSFYNMVVMRSFIYSSVPESLIESAELDGANDIQTLIKVVLPMCKPVMATVALWNAVAQWNDYTTAMVYNETSPHLYPLQYILMKLVKESEVIQSMMSQAAMYGLDQSAVAAPTPDSVKAATIIVITIPIILVYPFLQKYFIKGAALGAVKE